MLSHSSVGADGCPANEQRAFHPNAAEDMSHTEIDQPGMPIEGSSTADYNPRNRLQGHGAQLSPRTALIDCTAS